MFGLLLLAKAKKERKKSLSRLSFELPANQHSQFGLSGLDWLCWLTGNSKG